MASQYNLDISNFGRTVLNLAHRPFRAAPLLRRTSVLPQAKPRRKGGFAALSISIPKGGGRLRRPEPKKEDTLSACLPFCSVLTKKMQVAERDKTALQGRAAFAAYERFSAGKTSAEGRLCRPEHFNPGGWRPPSAAGTQKERHAFSVSFFLVTQRRFELRTPCLKGRCSAN